MIACAKVAGEGLQRAGRRGLRVGPSTIRRAAVAPFWEWSLRVLPNSGMMKAFAMLKQRPSAAVGRLCTLIEIDGKLENRG